MSRSNKSHLITMTAMTDKLWVLVLFLFMMFALAVANMHKQAKITKDAPITQSGVMQVLMVWPDKSCADIDLWMQAPGDQHAVGFNHRDDTTSNLLRDDRGCIDNPTGINFEMDQTHGLPAGEYIINTMYYQDWKNEGPVKVHVIVTVKVDPESDTKTVADEWVTLQKATDIATPCRITLDSKGNVTLLAHLPKIIVNQEARNMSAMVANTGSGRGL